MERLSPIRTTLMLALLTVAQLMIVLDFSIVNVALPSLQHAFQLTEGDLQWVVSAYALMFGGFLLLCGRAADLFDRKRLFLLGLGLFSLSSLVGGLATSPLVILMARAAQGLGAAIVSPAALSLLTTTFSEGPERDRALGVFGAVSGIGFSVGVLLGGLLTSLLNWRWVFFVNVPVGLLALLSALWLLSPGERRGVREPLDLLGAMLGTGALALLVFALSRLAEPGAGAGQALIALIVALILAGGFFGVEYSSSHPLIPLRIFRVRNLTVANLVSLLGTSTAGLFAFVLTLYLQDVLDFAPLATGLAFLLPGLAGIMGARLAILMIRRAGLRVTLALGPFLIALGSLLLTRITASSGVVWVILGYSIAGIGIVCMLVSATIVATMQLAANFQGVAAGLLTTSQQLGSALGTGLASLVVTSVVFSVGEKGKVAATIGDQAALFLALLLALLACGLACLARPTAHSEVAATTLKSEPHRNRAG